MSHDIILTEIKTLQRLEFRPVVPCEVAFQYCSECFFFISPKKNSFRIILCLPHFWTVNSTLWSLKMAWVKSTDKVEKSHVTVINIKTLHCDHEKKSRVAPMSTFGFWSDNENCNLGWTSMLWGKKQKQSLNTMHTNHWELYQLSIDEKNRGSIFLRWLAKDFNVLTKYITIQLERKRKKQKHGFWKEKKRQYGNTNTSSKHVFLENQILFKINIKRLGT